MGKMRAGVWALPGGSGVERGRGRGRGRGPPSGRLRAGDLVPRGGGAGGPSEVSSGPEGSQNRPLRGAWRPG